MGVREKLVELLNGVQHYGTICAMSQMDDRYASITQVSNTEAAESLIAHGVTVQEWISTDERMPTEDDATDGYVAVVYDWGDGVKTKTISLVDVVIAHPDLYDYWMPLNLPQPPKGE
jgi:hypothetical protein